MSPQHFGPGTFNVFTKWTLTDASGDLMFGPCSGTVTVLPDGDHLGLIACSSSCGTGRLEDASVTFSVTALTTNVSVTGGFMKGDVEATAEGLLSYH